MDIATIIGLMGGTALIITAIFQGGSIMTFFNIPGLLIVAGGTVAASFIKFSMGDVINSFKVVMKAFTVKLDSQEEVIRKMLHFARIAKKDGLVALEGAKKSGLGGSNDPKEGSKKGKSKPDPAKKVGDEFASKAIDYLADGYDEGLIEDLLYKDIRITAQRHSVGQEVFKGMGAAAPAFGMIGTLIGLVQMLSSMSDPSTIGPSMAIALLTTLYGALIANLICLPLADKLGLRSQQEQDNRAIVMEATMGIHRGVTPMILEESLKVFLAPKERTKVGAKKGAKAKKQPKKKK